MFDVRIQCRDEEIVSRSQSGAARALSMCTDTMSRRMNCTYTPDCGYIQGHSQHRPRVCVRGVMRDGDNKNGN